MTTPQSEPYRFDPDFERVVAFMIGTHPSFYSRIGYLLEESCLSHPCAKLVAETVHLVAIESLRNKKKGAAQGIDVLDRKRGKTPNSRTILMQALRNRMTEDGRVRLEQIQEVDAYFTPEPREEEEGIVSRLKPILQRRAQQTAMEKLMDEYANRKDAVGTQKWLDVARDVGAPKAVNTTITLGPQVFEALEELKTLQRLRTGITELDSYLGGGMLQGQLGVGIGGPGDGKCHAAGQGILLFDGSIKKVEDLQVGDLLRGPDSQPRRILRTNRGRGYMVDIVPLRGSPWRVNLDHILTLVGNTRYAGHVVDVSVREYLTWSKRRKHAFKLWRAPVEFEAQTTPLPLDPYFLGVLLGDGSFSGWDIRVTTADVEIVKELQVQATKFGLRVYPHAAHRTAPSYGLSGVAGKKNPIARCLETLSLRGCDCENKFIPQVYKCASRSERLAILAGLLDTDGATNNSAYDFISKSKRLAEDVAFIARSLGFAAVVSTCYKSCQTGARGVYFWVGISGAVTEIPCRLQRKQVPVRRAKKDVLRTGFTIVPTNEEEAFYGFTLDGDGRYLLDDFIVTHNSMWLIQCAAEGLLSGRNVAVASLELPSSLMSARLMANLTGFQINEITDAVSQRSRDAASLIEQQEGLGHCIFQDFTPQGTYVQDIFEWVEQQEQLLGYGFEVVVVDYADKLISKKAERLYEAMRYVYEDLRLFADKNSPKRWCWTASQSTRKEMVKGKDGEKRAERTRIHNASDSIEKIRVADLVLGLTREGEYYVMSVEKNRTGESGKVFDNMLCDFARGRIVQLNREGLGASLGALSGRAGISPLRVVSGGASRPTAPLSHIPPPPEEFEW